MIQRLLTLAAIVGMISVPTVLMTGCGGGEGDTTPPEMVMPEPSPDERPPAPGAPDPTQGGGSGGS